MRVLVAPDSFGGTLGPVAAADAIAAGWREVRSGDELDLAPLSDGGEGLLDAWVAAVPRSEVRTAEVVGPRGLATLARWAYDAADRVAVVEAAQACGLALLEHDRRDPRLTTTWGVGQLLEEARRAGARRVLVGCGGTATVDGGAGALSALGFRLTVADGSGLKIGGEDLPTITGAAPRWVAAAWDDVEVVLLVDVTEPLAAAPATYGPQKGADAATVAHLEGGLAAVRVVFERDLGAPHDLADQPGTGAAGGLPYAMAAALGATLLPGATAFGDRVGLADRVQRADLVLSGEGRLDATTASGKVVQRVFELAGDTPVGLVVGQLDGAAPAAPHDLEQAAPDGPGSDPAAEVAAAAARLAGRWRHGSG